MPVVITAHKDVVPVLGCSGQHRICGRARLIKLLQHLDHARFGSRYPAAGEVYSMPRLAGAPGPPGAPGFAGAQVLRSCETWDSTCLTTPKSPFSQLLVKPPLLPISR